MANQEHVKLLLSGVKNWNANRPANPNLRGANLREANLREAIGNGKEIISICLDQFICVMTKDVLRVGCQQHPWKIWEDYSNTELVRMDDSALAFREKWGTTIQQIRKTAFGGE